ncbi:MAG: transcriptional regulator NanR [Hyphomicrobiales bacterium]|nr:transcriptional regulator NanR [Hyphomicrobiales bacterium]
MQQPVRWVGRLNSRNRPKVKSPDDAYAHLLEAIVDQRLMPGTKLSELSLVETFGIGRRAINAVLQRLAWEHLVVIFPNRGAFVAAPDAGEVRNIFAARIAIEGGTTHAVASRGDPADIARLESNIAAEHVCREQGRLRDAIQLSGGFHLLMATLSGNTILAEQVRLLVARTSLAINLFENEAGLAGWHDHHGELIELCRTRQADAAVSLMQEHIRELERSMALDKLRPVAYDLLAVFGRE